MNLWSASDPDGFPTLAEMMHGIAVYGAKDAMTTYPVEERFPVSDNAVCCRPAHFLRSIWCRGRVNVGAVQPGEGYPEGIFAVSGSSRSDSFLITS